MAVPRIPNIVSLAFTGFLISLYKSIGFLFIVFYFNRIRFRCKQPLKFCNRTFPHIGPETNNWWESEWLLQTSISRSGRGQVLNAYMCQVPRIDETGIEDLDTLTARCLYLFSISFMTNEPVFLLSWVPLSKKVAICQIWNRGILCEQNRLFGQMISNATDPIISLCIPFFA